VVLDKSEFSDVDFLTYVKKPMRHRLKINNVAKQELIDLGG